MDEHDFTLLLTLAQTLNITHAAERLYQSQSSLSKRLIAIENQLGTTLFIRDRKGIHLTAAGDIAIRRIQAAQHELSEMHRELALAKHVIAGHIRLGVSINYAHYALPDVLAEFMAAYPQVAVHVTSGDSRALYQQLLAGNLEMAILRGNFAWPGVKVLLQREAICVIKPPHAASDLPYIGRKTDLPMVHQINQWFKEQGLTHAAPVQYVDDLTTCVALVQRGRGWALVPEIALGRFTGSITPAHFANGEPFQRATYVMLPSALAAQPQLQAFLQTLTTKE
ncbi:LysR family transcriptional regulator [Lacticaseibacillus baoqingensis]|uniref:LysR family transcriptional regulator n=1 Tax=Lacticaseibacillus baoqingensis TaxID=2486013 RepID=A0ABW4E861_9LACO|nr:LysR family transcriptional regulator [Lacticaseibacillus baoqingensis]